MELDVDPDTEIDPMLYVKCRLCIKETGSFRIHQIFQEQIKYCFDITVTHLDGLPQLICRKCKTVLSDYAASKKTFVENQAVLVQKFKESSVAASSAKKTVDEEFTQLNNNEEKETKEANTEPQIKNDSSSEDEPILEKQKRPKRRKNLIVSTSSVSDDETSQIVHRSDCVSEAAENVNDSQKDTSPSWQIGYDKKFVCRFCNLKFSSKELINIHVIEHEKLIMTCKKLLTKHCKVMMEKIELTPNLTGGLETVVLASDNIVCDEGSVKYFVRYLPMNDVSQKTDVSKRGRTATSKRIIYDDSSDNEDDDDDDFEPKKKRRIRSRSSSKDTVVIDDNDDKTLNEDHGKRKRKNRLESHDDAPDVSICIDDSSNDSPANAISRSQNKENKIIQDIASCCYRKYLSGYKNSDKSSKDDDLLIKKLLSTGTKVLSTQGTTTNGLIKYLNKKHLCVNWVPVSKQLAVGNKLVYVRINTKLDVVENNDDTGWSVIKTLIDDFNRDTEMVQSDDSEKSNTVYDNNVEPQDAQINNQNESIQAGRISLDADMPDLNITATEVSEANAPAQLIRNTNNEEIPSFPPTHNQPLQICEKKADAVVYQNENKLLNANPVANPKQLPKKATFSYDVKPITSLLQSELEKDNSKTKKALVEDTGESLTIDSDDESNMSETKMPIITCTQSLAPESKSTQIKPIPVSKSNELTNTETATEKFPRIKCKPVSQLMAPQNGVNNAESAIADRRQSIQKENVFTTQPMVRIAPGIAIQANTGSITMNSVDLPNTSTKHPIQYFNTLLKMHGLVLITKFNGTMSKDFVSLVKFRQDITQNGKSIILSLSLYSSGRVFYIKIISSLSNSEMEIDQLPANWQMHILQAFRGQVSDKILQNSMKISPLCCESAKTFVSLIKNIDGSWG